MSVYNKDGFTERVNYAAKCIVTGHTHGRCFDTCFEMNDGDVVVVALYRRSLNNPRLAEKLWKVICQESTMQAVEKLKHIPTRKLAEESRRQQEESARNFAIYMEECRSKKAAQEPLPQVEQEIFEASEPEPLPPFTLQADILPTLVMVQNKLF